MINKVAALVVETFIAFEPKKLYEAIEIIRITLDLGNLELAYDVDASGRQIVKKFSYSNLIEVFSDATTRSSDGIAGSFLLRNAGATVSIGIQWGTTSRQAWDRVIRNTGVSSNRFSVNFSYKKIAELGSASRVFDSFCTLSDLLCAEYGYVRSYGNKYKKRILRHWGIAGGLPGLFWANYFGPSIWSIIRSEVFEQTEGFRIVAFQNGAHAILIGETEESIKDSSEIEMYIQAIGEQYFAPIDTSNEKSGTFSVFSFKFISLALKLSTESRNFELDQKIFPIDFSGIMSP